MRKVKITLHKNLIHDFVDAATFKLTDAHLDQNSERAQNAVSADTKEDNDGFLVNEYCDRRDAILRARLKYCLEETRSVVAFDNSVDATEEDYEYNLNIDDTYTDDDLRSICKKMDTYIKRGAIFDWYLGAGIEPNDTALSIQELEDDIASSLRGRPWGRKPMQPFGPARFNYLKKDF